MGSLEVNKNWEEDVKLRTGSPIKRVAREQWESNQVLAGGCMRSLRRIHCGEGPGRVSVRISLSAPEVVSPKLPASTCHRPRSITDPPLSLEVAEAVPYNANTKSVL